MITRAGSRRGERVVAELAQDVARPADDLAGFRQGSALAALAVLHRRVVTVIGGAGPGMGLPGMGPGMGFPGMGMGMPSAGAGESMTKMRSMSAAEKNAKKAARRREKEARRKGRR